MITLAKNVKSIFKQGSQKRRIFSLRILATADIHALTITFSILKNSFLPDACMIKHSLTHHINAINKIVFFPTLIVKLIADSVMVQTIV